MIELIPAGAVAAMLSRVASRRARYGSADTELMVTSANPTEPGLRGNVERGARALWTPGCGSKHSFHKLVASGAVGGLMKEGR